MGIPNIPSNPGLRAAFVKHLLTIRGSSFAAIARELGVSRRAVSIAMRAPSERIELALADELGLPVHRLFPERYTPSGRRLHVSRPWKSSRGRSHANVHQQGAA
jgi:Ner family transcriptional regulator